MKFNHLWKLVGNTPMIEIAYRHKGEHHKLYVKCEQYNFTGSIKDRAALYLLEQAYGEGFFKTGDIIVEASNGNSGLSFSAIGRILGHEVRILLPDCDSRDRIDVLWSLGAKVILVSEEAGGLTGAITMAGSMACRNKQVFLPRQFEERYNVEVHERTTGREIWTQLQSIDIIPDAFVAGVGTGDTIAGVGKYLRGKNPSVKIHPLEATESPVLSTGCKAGIHRIHGISNEFTPAITEFERPDCIIGVSDGDAIIMAQKLAGQLGLRVGISSGANLLGAIKVQQEMGAQAKVVTVFSDSDVMYLRTHLLPEEPVRDGYLSPDVELLEYRTLETPRK